MSPHWPLVGRHHAITGIQAAALDGTGTVIVATAGQGKSVVAEACCRGLGEAGLRTELALCHDPSDISVHRLLTDDRALDVLVVDDAHLLTDDAAARLWSAAESGHFVAVATIRSGEPMPEGVAKLWTGGLCERLDLDPLTEAQVQELLVVVLGGDVEDRLSRAVHLRSEGNPLLIREIIRTATRSGAIERNHGLWRLAAPLVVDGGIVELIGHRFGQLSPAEHDGAELLALGEPLPLAVAEALVDAEVLESLERQGVLRARQVADDITITLAHPLYGEVLRSTLGLLGTRRIQQRLLNALECDPHHDRYVVRTALWCLDLEIPLSPEELVRASRIARSVGAGAAERLARAAVELGGSSEAIVCLAEILVQQGRINEVDQLLDEADTKSFDDAVAAELLAVRALAKTRLGELAEASAIFTNATEGLDAPTLQAHFALSETLDGRPSIGSRVARPLIDDAEAPPVARCIAGLALAAGGGFEGHFDEASAVATALRGLSEEVDVDSPFASGSMWVSGLTCSAQAGHLDLAGREANERYAAALETDDEWFRPRAASVCGIVDFLRGDVRAATRYFRITVASLNEFDGLFLRYNVAWLARAAAAAGLIDEARFAMQNVDERAPVCALFEFMWSMAEASVFAAEGQITRAIEHDLEAAQRAASAGLWGAASLAAFDALRYGGGPTAAGLVASSTERVDGPLPALCGRVARAVSAGDGSALDQASVDLERIGTLLYAADVAHLAGRSHRRVGDVPATLRALARSGELEGQCEGARRPWAFDAGIAHGLTEREREVAILAATGCSDAQLADRLGISIRTVQTHLARAYMKLDIGGRRDLPAALVGV